MAGSGQVDVGRGDERERFLLDGHVGVDVGVGGADVRVSLSPRAMTVVSTPACRSDIAQLWRRTWGCRGLPLRLGQVIAAVAAWVLTRCAIASCWRLRPVRVGNSGSSG